MKPIYVTSPLLPHKELFYEMIDDIWEKKWLTNNGEYHTKLEVELVERLNVENLSLVSNGTLALIIALQALDLNFIGKNPMEVITTPYSFIATSHALWWNNLKPIFVDIDPISFNIDPDKIESAITNDTVAILPVHVYGTPCSDDKISRIAKKYNLKLIYDAAHAFDVKTDGSSILNWGDASILSFHATKTFSTIEGGAIICKENSTKKKIDKLKNFGFANEDLILFNGINSKLNEVQAAYGLASLRVFDGAIKKRIHIANLYNQQLKDKTGIQLYSQSESSNYSYYPILVDEETYGYTRDELYCTLKDNNIYARKYFHPLISNTNPYFSVSSSKIENLMIANRVSNSVLCLPIHHEMDDNDVLRIVKVIREL